MKGQNKTFPANESRRRNKTCVVELIYKNLDLNPKLVSKTKGLLLIEKAIIYKEDSEHYKFTNINVPTFMKKASLTEEHKLNSTA